MKRTLFFLTLFFAAAATPAVAVDNGFYLGGSIGSSSFEIDDVDEDFGSFRFSDGDNAYKLFAGFRFLNFLDNSTNLDFQSFFPLWMKIS